MLKKKLAIIAASVAVLAPTYAHASTHPTPLRGQFTWSGKASVFEIGYGIATRCYECKFNHGYWMLEDPRHGVSIEEQTDWGPDPGTGRTFDLTEDTTANHSYSYSAFPTDQGTWTGYFIGYHIPKGLHYGRQSGGIPYHGWAPFRKRMEWHSKSYWTFIIRKYRLHYRTRSDIHT